MTPVTFTVTATPPTGDTIQSTVVAFGDGTSVDLGSGTTAQHVYGTANTYTATATVTTANQATNSASTVLVVR
jgi:hypothetical protein